MKIILKWLGRIALSLFFLILLIVLGSGIWVMSQPKVPETPLQLQEEAMGSPQYRNTADSALALLQSVALELELPSLSFAIYVDNQIVWAAALGHANVKEQKPSKLNTKYRAGSVSKSMTGLAAAKLVEMGKLDLDAPIRQYVSAFPVKRWEPTLRQLASHTGGIRHYAQPGHPSFLGEQFSQHHYTSVEESLVLFKDDSLLHEPGTGFQYSTHSFTLLSAALERAAGKSYLELVNELVWLPSQMQDTRADDLTQSDSNRMTPYVSMGGHFLNMEGPDPSYKWAGGGILTTPSDLVRMGATFMKGEIIEQGPADPMFISIPLKNGTQNPQNYALGWRNGTETDLLGVTEPLATLHHGGASPGGSSFLLIIPDGQVAGAVMTNLSLSNAWPMRKAVYQIAGMFRKEHSKSTTVLEAEKE